MLTYLIFGFLFSIFTCEEITTTTRLDSLKTGFIVDDNITFDLNDYTTHPCFRECTLDTANLTCYYKLRLDYHESLSEECGDCPNNRDDCEKSGCVLGDGNKAGLLLMNRMLPAPSVKVCLGDSVVVDLFNNINESTTLHWHGMIQTASPYMDGVPYVTQYPIPPKTIYRYVFMPDMAGTFFYHSHYEAQRAYGQAGSLIIRQPLSKETIIIQNKFRNDRNVLFLTDYTYNYTLTIRNILINGKGVSVTPTANNVSGYREQINVEYGQGYRLRFISNGFSACAMEVSIDNHSMFVLSVDGMDIVPQVVGLVTILPGERYDIGIRALETPGNYWIRVRDVGNCAASQLHQAAILHYTNVNHTDVAEPLLYNFSTSGLNLNALDHGPNFPLTMPVVNLTSQKPASFDVNAPVHQFFIELTRNGNQFQMNRITFAQPNSILLVDKDTFNQTSVCNGTSLALAGLNCSNTVCICTHLIKLPIDTVIEIIIFATGVHPFHAHGNVFDVIASDVIFGEPVTKSLIEQMDREGRIRRRFLHPLKKDTIQIPANGFTVIRFKATNPGFWLQHCHFDTHSGAGMASVLQIGDTFEMLPPPKNFNPKPLNK